MPLLISGAASVVSAMNRAFTNTSPSNAVYANQIVEAGTTAASQAAWAVSFGSKFTGTSADLAETLLTNTGIAEAGGEALATAVAAIIDIVGVANVGQVAMLLSNALSSLEGDATYGAAAAAWNAEVTNAYEYSANPANTQSSATGEGAVNEANLQRTLTVNQDKPVGTAGSETFTGVVGLNVDSNDRTTFNSEDIIDGGAGLDTLLVRLIGGNYGGGARVKFVENLQLATEDGAARTFNFNVSETLNNEITDVNTITYDQITTGENLQVNNVINTRDSDANGTADASATMHWKNEAGSRAGDIGITYRQATIAGTADNQQVILTNINGMNANDGRLNVGGGMETITINSAGTVANNTLSNTTNVDTGSNNQAADVISAGTLSKVVLTGAVAIGKAAGVVTDTSGARAAFIGQTDRVVGNDMGLTADATTNATESNLLSVGARVATVDASAMTASANVRFVAKNDGSATNVTFMGGEAADYVEFEVGNINATGGQGNDTFAFINGQNNSTFGEGDTINGGEGADTIQIGLNGNVQTYNISETELRNKESIGTIDLRGQTNFLTLSSDFVSKADTANSITVVTDKIIQTSATVALNPAGGANNGLENASTHTVNLSKLSANQTVAYQGGSGSDRIILNDANYNVLKTLVGGGNEGAAIAAGQNRYDTVTVVTNGENVVLDAEDLKNTSGFEGFVLTKNSAAATYNITLTRAFMNANTLAADDGNTGIIETNFQIGTSAAANNSILSGGDTVTIDVRDLLNATDNGRATGYTTRTFDVTSLENSGVAVTFIGNTGNLTLAQVRAAGIAVANGASANANDVVGLSPANPVGNVGRTLVFTATDGNTTTGWQITNNEVATANADTINVGALVLAAGAVVNGGAGVNTLVARDGANLAAATVANVTQLTFDATGVAGTNDLTMTQTQHAGFTGTVTAAGTGANGESITVTTGGAVAALAGVENYTVSAGGPNNVTVNAATTGVNITGNAANATTVTIGGQAVNGTYALGNAADVIVATTGANITGVNAGALTTAETLNLTGTITMTAAQYGNGTTTGLTTNAIINGGVADRINISDAFNAAIGAQANVVETVALRATGNDTVNVTTGAAADFIGTLNISAGGNDTITLTNAAQNAGTANSMTIAGFTATAGANMDVIRVVDTGVATISGPLTAVNAGANTNYGGAVNSVIEIENGGVVTLADVGAGNTVETLIGNAVGNLASGTYTVVVYGGTANANAGIYSLVSTAAGGDATAAVNITVELLGVVTDVGVNGLSGGNFAI